MTPSVGHWKGHPGRFRLRGRDLRCATTAFLLAMTVATALAADIRFFGPERFTRQPGKQSKVTRTFQVSQPPERALLRIENHGATANIWVNGAQVLDESDFKPKKRPADRDDRDLEPGSSGPCASSAASTGSSSKSRASLERR